MELEFDKEIDALLRKAKRGSPAAAVAPIATRHLDADELAAFAENALPEGSRQTYIAHLADCDNCRTMLSSFVMTAPEKAAAAFAAPAPVSAANVSWFRRFFSGPNLAYTMGSLVVLFSGFIGLLVYQNRQTPQSSKSAQVAEMRPTPQTESEPPQGVSNAAVSNTASNSNTASPVESVTKTGVAVGSANAGAPTTSNEESEPESRPDAAPKPADQQPLVAAAPPQMPQGSLKDEPATAANRDVKTEKETAADKLDDATLSADTAKRKAAEDQRELRSAAKSAPSKVAGPRQQQNSIQNGAIIQNQSVDGLSAGRGSMLEKKTDLRRSVGGKTFEMRGGVWYDSAFSGGGTKDVKRGTEKYLKLDEGLRNIANDLGGTVVIVWNGKAYKIK